MALTQKIKVAVYEVRPYEVQNNKSGITFKGFTVKGYKADGSAIAFTSPTPVKENDLGGYDEAVAAEFTLYGKSFQDQIKWSTEKPKTPGSA